MTLALETRALCRSFGGIRATDKISLGLPRGARYALIGPNGAGKTTLINLLTGVLAASSGRVLLDGQDISAAGVAARVRAGLVRTFQINQLFPEMTPLQSVALTLTQRNGAGAHWWRRLASRPAERDEAMQILESFNLADAANAPVASMPYGRQRLIEIALAIAARPRVLLLDEPAAGVPEGERDDILAAIAALPGDVSVLLIEHDMDLVFRFADRIFVLDGGRLLTEGTPQEVAADPRVRAVYLGENPHG